MVKERNHQMEVFKNIQHIAVCFWIAQVQWRVKKARRGCVQRAGHEGEAGRNRDPLGRRRVCRAGLVRVQEGATMAWLAGHWAEVSRLVPSIGPQGTQERTAGPEQATRPCRFWGEGA